MNKHKASQFVVERKGELTSLGTILADEKVIRDPEPLFQAAATCKSLGEIKPGEFRWRCSLASLPFVEFPLEETRLKHTKPSHVKFLLAELSVAQVGVCVDNEDLDDPFCELSVECLLQGRSDDMPSSRCAWHFDRHVAEELGHTGERQLVHPMYHLQYGGEQVWELTDEEFGRHLLLEPPRIAHPPLDIALAVDFVLSNYYGREWKRLREIPAYREIVREAQHRAWRPYAIATALQWGSAPDSTPWYGGGLWPHFIPSESDLVRAQIRLKLPAN